MLDAPWICTEYPLLVCGFSPEGHGCTSLKHYSAAPSPGGFFSPALYSPRQPVAGSSSSTKGETMIRRNKYAAPLFACCLAVAAAMLFAAGAAPPLIQAAQAGTETQHHADFGMTMKSMPSADVLEQAPKGPPDVANVGHHKLKGSVLGLIVFGLFLAVSLMTRPRAYPPPPRQGVADVFRPNDREDLQFRS